MRYGYAVLGRREISLVMDSKAPRLLLALRLAGWAGTGPGYLVPRNLAITIRAVPSQFIKTSGTPETVQLIQTFLSLYSPYPLPQISKLFNSSLLLHHMHRNCTSALFVTFLSFLLLLFSASSVWSWRLSRILGGHTYTRFDFVVSCIIFFALCQQP
jgi:hypothetical protein